MMREEIKREIAEAEDRNDFDRVRELEEMLVDFMLDGEPEQ